MQIASQHAEAVGERSGISVEEWLLLDGIALHSGNVTPGNVELAAVIEADFADAGLSIGNGAAVAAGIAANAMVVDLLPESRIGFADAGVGGQDVVQCGHSFYFTAVGPGCALRVGLDAASQLLCSLAELC